MKKYSANTIINAVAAIMLLVTLIVIEVSFKTAQGWFDTNYNPVIIGLGVLGIALLAIVILLNVFAASKTGVVFETVKRICSAGACACAGVMVGLVLGAIVTEMAYTFFSDFNQGTAKEAFMPTACIQAIVGMVLAVITIIITTVANAFSYNKENSVAVTK